MAHARELAPRMRPVDAAEIFASGGFTPLGAISCALKTSDVAWTAFFDGQVACMWGVRPALRTVTRGRVGVVWLMSSDLIERHPRIFWVACQHELALLLDQYDELVNAIDVRHVQAIRWGRRLGFRFRGPEPFGLEKRLFQHFTVRKEDLYAESPGSEAQETGQVAASQGEAAQVAG